MASHINKDIRSVISHQSLGSGSVFTLSSCHHSYKVFDCHLITPVVNFNVRPIHINVVVLVVEHLTGLGVPRVAGHVVAHHQDYLAVRDSQPLHTPVH